MANSDDNTVSALLNTTAPGSATPSFATQQTFATGTGPNSVTTADINGDGKADLIMGNSGATAVLLNTTAPSATTTSFVSQQSFVVGLLNFPVTADVNDDGHPDLIAANASLSKVSVFLNTQYQALFTGSPATGTIVHDYIFANGFE